MAITRLDVQASFEVRCECHKLLMRISSTSRARLEIKCPRCKTTLSARVGGGPVFVHTIAASGATSAKVV